MWKKGRMFAAGMLALAWWSVFYPELCFTEGTCEAVQTGEADAVPGILWADGDVMVIGSRLLEWCEDRLFDGEMQRE